MKSNNSRYSRRFLTLLVGGLGLLLALSGVCGGVPAQAQTLTPAVAGSPTAEIDQQEPTIETLEARIVSATPPGPCSGQTSGDVPLDEDEQTQDESQLCQQIELLFTDGSLKGQRVIIEDGQIPVAERSAIVYKAGDLVLVDHNSVPGQPDIFYITDFVRTNQILILALIFVGLVIAFGGFKGFSSLLGLAFSFLILLYFLLPRIVAGDDPVVVSIIGSFFIMLATLYLSHGFSLKTTAALIGTAISLVITGVLAWLFVDIIRLSGFGSEDATFVHITQGATINLRGLLLGSIIIGALGVLDDLTISQAAAVFELRRVDPTLTARKLFQHVTNIGRDHIAATVNTLVLAYAGASLPLLILFVTGAERWDRVINTEIVAEEIVRTLVGSIGLMAAVPVTTWLASLLAIRTTPRPLDPGEGSPVSGHHHH